MIASIAAALVLNVAQNGALLIRSAEVDISPPEPLPLGGYTARQGKVMDPLGTPLYARCVLFTEGEWNLAIVSVEMLTAPESLSAEVAKRIPPNFHLFLAATHTHCAPDSQMLNERMKSALPGIAPFKRRLLNWYADKIASSVTNAIANEALPYGSLSACEFDLPLNRGRRMGAQPDPIATLVGADGIQLSDQVVQALKAGGMRRVGHTGYTRILAEYAAHPVFYGAERNQTSGDWPGLLSPRLSDANLNIPVLVGAIGDVSPAAPGDTPQERISHFVDEFIGRLHAVEGRSTKTVWRQGDPVRFVQQDIPLDRPFPHPDFNDAYHVPGPLAIKLVKGFAPDKEAVTAFRFGGLAVVGIPGEPTSHLGRLIRNAGLAMGYQTVLVISHVDGWMGYILDPADYGRGGYEATLSFYGAQEGEHVVQAAISALKSLRA